jgi:hypothetical protein
VRKSLLAVLLCSFVALSAVAEDAAAPRAAVAAPGKMLMASDGARLGQVYRVNSDGAAQVILDGKLVTVPASTLSTVDGKLTTSLSKRDAIALH